MQLRSSFEPTKDIFDAFEPLLLLTKYLANKWHHKQKDQINTPEPIVTFLEHRKLRNQQTMTLTMFDINKHSISSCMKEIRFLNKVMAFWNPFFSLFPYQKEIPTTLWALENMI